MLVEEDLVVVHAELHAFIVVDEVDHLGAANRELLLQVRRNVREPDLGAVLDTYDAVGEGLLRTVERTEPVDSADGERSAGFGLSPASRKS